MTSRSDSPWLLLRIGGVLTPALAVGLVLVPVSAPVALPAVAQQATSGQAALDSDEPNPGEKRPIQPEDYDRWERLGGHSFSDDGTWISFTVSRVEGTSDLHVVEVEGGRSWVIPEGRQPTFSEDGRWLLYSIGVSREERERLQERRQPVRNDLGIRDLRTGDSTVVEDVASFSISPDGRFVAMRRYPPQGQGGGGNGAAADRADGVDIVVRELGTETDLNIGNVSDFEWADEGALLALTIDAAGKAGNGIYLFDPPSGILRPLETAQARYQGMTWLEDGRSLAALRLIEDGGEEWADSSFVVLAWNEVTAEGGMKHAFDPRESVGFPEGMKIVDFSGLRWSDDGRALYFGIKERTPKDEKAATEEEVEPGEGEPEPEAEGQRGRGGGPGARGGGSGDDEDEAPGVEIWHARDVDIIPTQKRRANGDRRENFLSVWWVESGDFVQLEDEIVESVSVGDRSEGPFMGSDQDPYELERMFGPSYRDIYAVDPRTGDRRKIADRVQFSNGFSPSGKYYLHFDQDQYWITEVESGERHSITANVDAVFTDVDDDHTVEQKPPHGTAGWVEREDAVLLYDKYDLWRVAVDGSGGERLTRGAEGEVRHRIQRFDFDEDYVDLDGPVYFSTYGEWTKKSGYSVLRPGEDAPKALLWRDKDIGRLTKADEADVYAYVEEDFADSPDVFVTGPDLAGARQVSETNAFQSEYLWGKGELIEYENDWGVKLQAALHYPAGYEPGKKYPMLVYYYEKTSQNLHSYPTPSKTSPYNSAVYTAEGYFVLRPDIVYRDRNPGLSAVAALVPAVKAAVATGMIDEERVGLVGHSWGGYQTAFTVTQTDVFAAAVAGAPLTNLVSMYLSIYWNTGGTDARIFEISQGRMEVPPWDDMESYTNNSPIHNIEGMNTPLLVAFGTEDGAVEFNQGVEFYNAARRAGKDFVMLVYEGENHSLAREPNQLDYHRRILEWFGHYLKGEPAPKWISEGMTFLEQEEALKRRGNGGQ